MPAIGNLAAQGVAMLAQLEKRKPLPIGPYEGSPTQVDVQLSLGAENIGIWVAQVVYGANLVQSVRYWNHFPNDHILMKFTVGFLMLLDFIGVVAYIRLMYFWDVLSWGNVYALSVLDWSFFMDIFLTGLVPAVVQCYFCWRVYAVSGRTARVMPAIIVLCALMEIVFSLVVMIGVWGGGTPDHINNWLWGVYSWFIPGCLADALITFNMLYYLQKAKRTSSFSRTRGILNKFVVLVFETNAITFLGALGILVLFAWGNQTTLAYNALTYVVGKLYVLSLLLATNLRIDLRERDPSGSGMELSGSGGDQVRKRTAVPASGSQWGPARSFNPSQSYGDRGMQNFAQAVKVTTVAQVQEEDFGEKGGMGYHSPSAQSGVEDLRYNAA